MHPMVVCACRGGYKIDVDVRGASDSRERGPVLVLMHLMALGAF